MIFLKEMKATFFIKSFTNTTGVILCGSSMNHQFDLSRVNTGSSLCSIRNNSIQRCSFQRRHNIFLRKTFTGGGIIDKDGRLDRIIVTRDRLSDSQVPSGAIIQDSSLHFKAHGVSIEDVIIVNTGSFHHENDFFSLTIVSRNTVNEGRKLNAVGKIIVNTKISNDFVAGDVNLKKIFALVDSERLRSSVR